MMTYIFKDSPELVQMFKVGYVSSLSTKLCDTCQSEIGKAFGKTTLLIKNLKPVPPGTEGAISLEGYLAGLLGSIALTSIAFNLDFINFDNAKLCIVAPLIATTIESYIGATFQDDKKISNELVNLINTFIGSLIAMCSCKIN